MRNIVSIFAVIAAVSGAASAQTWDGAGAQGVMPDVVQIKAMPSQAPKVEGISALTAVTAGKNDAVMLSGLEALVAADVSEFIKYSVTTAAKEREKLACLENPKTRKTPYVERSCNEHGCDAVGSEYIGVQCGAPGKDRITTTINQPGSKFKVLTEKSKTGKFENFLVYLPLAPEGAASREEFEKAGALVSTGLFLEAFKKGIPVGIAKGIEEQNTGSHGGIDAVFVR